MILQEFVIAQHKFLYILFIEKALTEKYFIVNKPDLALCNFHLLVHLKTPRSSVITQGQSAEKICYILVDYTGHRI